MEILYFFEKLRNPFLDKLFYYITFLGDEVFFIILAITVYWCISKKLGYYLMSVSFFGIVMNQILKVVCKVPRPWVRDPSFSIVEMARESAPGYSFPSGHTQNAVSIAGCLSAAAGASGLSKQKKAVFISVCTFLALMVSLSRMYLGVHTFQDVLMSVLLALALTAVFFILFRIVEKKPFMMYLIISGMLAASVCYLVISYNTAAQDAQSLENILSSQRHAWYMVGGVTGMAVAYPIEQKFVRFETKAPMAIQILKVIPGAAGVFGIKMLEEPLLLLFGGHMTAHAVRYFLIVMFAVCGWPAIFNIVTKKLHKNH